MPDSITTGISNTIADKSNATSCVCATFEMSNPSESANNIYNVETATIQNNEPTSGTSST